MARLSTRFAAEQDAAARTSIAVLPIADASNGRDAADLCQALGDGVISRLSRLAGVRVCARGAVSPYANMVTPPVAAGRELGVELVAAGVLTTPAGTDEIAVHLELIRVADGALVREATFRANRNNLFVLEGTLTSAIVPFLGRGGDATGVEPDLQPMRDGEAYVLCVRGTYLFLRAAHVGGRPEDLLQSREFFERALARDPAFGLAYAGLANFFAVAAARGILRPVAEHFGHAIALCRQALALDATLAIPHVHFGVRAMYLESDWPAAREEFTRAVALDPHYAEARRFLGIYLGATGQHADGIRELREAIRLEPHMPLFRNSLADALMAVGEHDMAIIELRAALQLDAGYRAARDRLARCFERTGRLPDAIDARRALGAPAAAERFEAAFTRDGAQGYRQERARELRAIIAELSARLAANGPENAGDLFNPPELRLALAHAELGEWDEAFAWEQRVSAAHPGRRQWFAGRPELDPLAGRRAGVNASAGTSSGR
jgi:TolB-like protein/tetratricopeptide (TPR) repeat protein